MFVFIGVICCKYTSIKLHSIINVTNCLTLPLIIICTIQVFLTYIFGLYYSIPPIEYWLVLILYIIITSIVEIFTNKCFDIYKITPTKLDDCFFYQGTGNINIILKYIIIIFILYACYDSFIVVKNIDISMILQDEGQDEFGASMGGGFYARVFLMIIATYFFGYGNNWKDFGFGFLCLFPSLVINTKGIIFIPIVAGFIVRLYLKKIKNIKKLIVLIGLIGIIIFFSSYMWEFFTIGENPLSDSYRWQLISEKLLYYLTSGVQGFSANLDNIYCSEIFSKYENITLAPFNNFLSKFGITENVSAVSQHICYIGNLPTYGVCNSNVNTYIGTIYLYNCFFCGLLLHSFWVCITSIIRKLAFVNNQPFTVCLFALFATGYALGWFEFYFMHTFWVYMIVMVIILNCFNSLKLNLNAKI